MINMEKTYTPKKDDIKSLWYLVDLDGKILGKAAVTIANYLRGKHKPIFTPHINCGDYIVAINAEKVRVTGKKTDDKTYYSHSGYPGSLRETKLKELLKTDPKRVVEEAVSGMLPRNKLRKEFMAKLRVFNGSKHPHQAQKLVVLEM